MKMYVIKDVVGYKDKEGQPHFITSYFKEHKMGIMNLMESSPEKAKQYEWISDARRERRIYFHNSPRTSIVKITVPDIETT